LIFSLTNIYIYILNIYFKEYFSLINFANPGLLGTSQEFRRKYEIPILRGRDSESTDKEKELGEERLKELLEITNKFTIRRTSDLLSKYCNYQINIFILFFFLFYLLL